MPLRSAGSSPLPIMETVPAAAQHLSLVNPAQPSTSRALTAVIYGTDRAKFGGNPEAVLQSQRICVTGLVSFFRQKPEMILSSPTQVSYFPRRASQSSGEGLA